MIVEGVSFEDNVFKFDFSKDEKTDVIYVTQTFDNISEINNNIYYFGYKFNENIDGRIKSEFLKQIKYKDLSTISNEDYSLFIKKSVNELHKKVNLAKVDLIVYPETKSPLVMDMLKYIYGFTAPTIKNIELVKNSIENIEFDYKNFNIFIDSSNLSRADKNVLKSNVENMMKDVKSNSYFSIAKSIKKPKYREYFKNFLIYKNKQDKEIIEAIESDSNILIVDDINTSTTTIKELIRNINLVNDKTKKIIFTLIGK
jgi:hypothetical protein